MGMLFRYDTALDRFQRELATEALLYSGAPFDPSNPPEFREGVRRTWGYYQALREKSTGGGLNRLRHGLDKLLYTRNEEEFIDSEAVLPERREKLIGGLDRLNSIRRSYDVFRFVLRRAVTSALDDDVTILDIGSGHGRLPIYLASKGRLAGKRLRVIGSDISPLYVSKAKRNARRRRSPAEFRVLDATKLSESDERFDVIVSSQTVHHFPPELFSELLYNMRAAARTAVIIVDARRAATVLAGAIGVTGAVAFDPMLIHDGAVSVRKMYTPAEIELLARCAPGGERYQSSNFLVEYTLTECYV